MPTLTIMTGSRTRRLGCVVTLTAAAGVGLAACGTGQPAARSAGSHLATLAPAAASSTAGTNPTVSRQSAGSATSRSTGTTTAGLVDTAIKVYGNCATPSFEPSEIVLTCADANEVLTGLRWTSWTATSATAVGTLEYNDCHPYCAAGHLHDVPGTLVTLTVPVPTGNGQQVWSRVQESPEPPGYSTGPYGGAPQPLTTRPD